MRWMLLVITLGSASSFQGPNLEIAHLLSTTSPEAPLFIVLDINYLHQSLSLFGQPPQALHAIVISYTSQGTSARWVASSGSAFRTWLEERISTAEPDNSPTSIGYYGLLRAVEVAPPGAPVLLVTGRPPSDTKLIEMVMAAFVNNKHRLYVAWYGSQDQGRGLFKIAQDTGGRVIMSQHEDQPREDRAREPISGNLTEASLLLRYGISGKLSTPIQVDSTVVKLHVGIAGHVTTAVLRAPHGEEKNLLLDQLEDVVEAVVNTPSSAGLGTWWLHTDGTNYTITVDALTKFNFKTKIKHSPGGKAGVVELAVEGDVGAVQEVALLDGQGKHLVTVQDRIDRLELDETLQGEARFIQLTGKDPQGEPFTRISYIPQEDTPLPYSVEVDLGSTLAADVGETPTILFKVTNNRWVPLWCTFRASDNSRLIRRVYPLRAMIQPRSFVQVRVDLARVSEDSQRGNDIVALTAESFNDAVTKRAYVQLGKKQVYDSTGPYIWYYWKGDCRNAYTPTTCHLATWGAEVIVRDYYAGLLQVRSHPAPLVLNSEFIAGTTDEIKGKFTASCCYNKVEITALDVVGNSYSRTINVDDQWFRAGDIAAITLGIILIIILIAAIIALIVWCCRQNSQTLHIYPNY